MKKRAAVARARGHGSEILFFDEPSAGLIPSSPPHRSSSSRAQQAFRMTIIVVTTSSPALLDRRSHGLDR